MGPPLQPDAIAEPALPGQYGLPFGEPERLPAESEAGLIRYALALGARKVRGWSQEEESAARSESPPPPQIVRVAQRLISDGSDPLGEAFCELRGAEERRSLGATYTPPEIVGAMLSWASRQARPVRVVDPGVGSGRFLVAAGRRFPDATLIGFEIDPLAAALGRAHLAAAGLAERAHVVRGDYRALDLPSAEGPTLFVGNPPYVRHHLIAPGWKAWLKEQAERLGYRASKLAGLHVHFFLATALAARPGDVGAFVTSAEWLDVNYGRLVREVLLDTLGVDGVHVVEPTARAFDDAQTTAVVTTFTVGERPAAVRLRRVADRDDLGALSGGHAVHRERLAAARRWSPLTRAPREAPEGLIELGELCRVHRGQVTGANKVWIAGAHSAGLPASVLFPSVTRARELFEAGPALHRLDQLRRVIDLPADLGELSGPARGAVERFLDTARRMGAHEGYIARHRRAWWSVGLREPAPVLATYMARRPPAFVRNPSDARHINVAHGLYPREPLSDDTLSALASFLGRWTRTGQGRTYAGGLTKFEPKEMERLLVPTPAVLGDPDQLAELSAALGEAA